MTTENQPSFREGETIFDVDGNAYTVRDGHAVLNVEGATNGSYFLDSQMSQCFRRRP